jgi:hypothetical protein
VISSSVIGNLSDSAIAHRKCPKTTESGVECGLHRSFSTLHGLGYLLDGKVGVEPEDDSHTLTRGQLAERSHDREMGSDSRSHIRMSEQRGRSSRGAVTAVLLATPLAHGNHEDPRRWPIEARDRRPLLEGSGEGLLGSVLWIATVTEAQPKCSADAGIVAVKELLESIVRRGHYHLPF